MQCQQANDLFSDYLERALDPALTVSVDNHLAACLSCREEVAGLGRVWTQLKQLPSQEPPAALHADIVNALDAHLAEAKREAVSLRHTGTVWDWRTLFRPRMLAYGATLLILALGSLEVVQSQRAAMGPLGMIMQSLHLKAAPLARQDAPLAVTATGSLWMANPDESGTLVVRLKSSGATSHLLAGRAYHAELVRRAATGDSHPATSLTVVQGTFEANGDAAVSLPMAQKLPEGDLALIVTLDTGAMPSSDVETPLRVTVPLKIATQP